MPTSNPLEILVAHNEWATKNILLACEKLTQEQFTHPFEIGPGSLQATLIHIISAIRTWTDVLAQRELRPRLEVDRNPYTASQLLAMFDHVTDEFKFFAFSHPLDEFVKRIHNGSEFILTRGAVITHVATHGMHHRAQCLNMLRHLGVTPLPNSSVADWTFLGDRQ